MSDNTTKAVQEFFGPSNIPVDWKLEIRAAKRGDRKLLIASILAGKPVDGADDAQELRDTIARALAGKLRSGQRGKPKAGLDTKNMFPWGVGYTQFALINPRSDGKQYRAARSLWQYQRDGMTYADALEAAAEKHRLSQGKLHNWLRRTRPRASNDGDDGSS